MMSIIRANGVESVTVSEDGNHALFKFQSTNHAKKFSIVLPSAALAGLMTLASQASSRATSILQSESGATKHQAFRIDASDVEPYLESEGIIVSFRLPNGMSFAFEVHGDMANYMRDVLNVLLGYESSAPLGTQSH